MNSAMELTNRIRIISHNCAKSQNVMQSILHTAINTADIILIQEPWIRLDRETGQQTSISHPSFHALIPATNRGGRKARVMAFISSTHPFLKTTPRPDICPDPDLQVLEISTVSIPTTLILNIYNEAAPGNDNQPIWTVERSLVSIPLPPRAIILGDFNAHHPWWTSRKRPTRADNLVQWAEENQLHLLNEPDIATYTSRSTGTESVLDLGFSTPDMNQYVINWAVDDEDATGSDHLPLRLDIVSPSIDTVTPPTASRYNYKKTDWDIFADTLMDTLQKYDQQWKDNLLLCHRNENLDNAAELLTYAIQEAIKSSTPELKPSPRAKIWWNEDISEHHRIMKSAFRE